MIDLATQETLYILIGISIFFLVSFGWWFLGNDLSGDHLVTIMLSSLFWIFALMLVFVSLLGMFGIWLVARIPTLKGRRIK